jgi:hypothetical protein
MMALPFAEANLTAHLMKGAARFDARGRRCRQKRDSVYLKRTPQKHTEKNTCEPTYFADYADSKDQIRVICEICGSHPGFEIWLESDPLTIEGRTFSGVTAPHAV